MWRLSQRVLYLLLPLWWLSVLSDASGFHSTVGNVFLSAGFLRQCSSSFACHLLRTDDRRQAHTLPLPLPSALTRKSFLKSFILTFMPKPLIQLSSLPFISVVNTRIKSNRGEASYFSLLVRVPSSRELSAVPEAGLFTSPQGIISHQRTHSQPRKHSRTPRGTLLACLLSGPFLASFLSQLRTRYSPRNRCHPQWPVPSSIN